MFLFVVRPGTTTAPRADVSAWARAGGVVLALAGLTAGLYMWRLSALQPLGGQRDALVPLIGLGAWAASTQRVPVRNRRASVSFSFTDIPILVAVPFLSPATALIAVAGGVLAAQVQNRRPPAKALVNSLAYPAAMSPAILFYDQGLGRSSPASLQGWLVGAGALAIYTVLDDVVILAAGAVLSGRWRPPPLGPFAVHTLLDLFICTVAGLSAIVLIESSTWYVALLAVIVAAGDVGWRKAVAASQRYATLQQLYDFSRALASAQGGERELAAVVLDGARSLFSASRAEMVLTLDPPLEHLAVRSVLSGDGPVETEEAVPLSELAGLVADLGPSVIRPGTAHHRRLGQAHAGVQEALVAPFRVGAASSGYLLISERAFSHEGFGPEDLQLLEALVANAAVSIRRAGLVDRLRYEAALRHSEARSDPLTGLANRAVVTERLLRAAEGGATALVALVLVDLDGFKRVNDTLGHHAGDLVLVEVARRLGPMQRPGTLVARLGGDEFVLLVDEEGTEERARHLADEALAAILEPMAVGDLTLDVRASVGVAALPAADALSGSLLRNAELAMYQAKAHGGGSRWYEASRARDDARRASLPSELRKALDNGALRLHYQAVIDIRTGRATAFEALARWRREDGEEVPPGVFIPVAERSGLIQPLTWWVVDTALAQLKLWRRTAPGVSVAVNLSAVSLLAPRFAKRVGETVAQCGLGAEALRLDLKLAEAPLLAEMGGRALSQLTELGVALCIDDFGTGHSTLTGLRHLPFDEVKIDRGFVSRMCWDRDDEAVVRSVIELAKGLQKQATAEGVEDEPTLRRLEQLGCQAAQGFWLGRPSPADQCEAELRAAHRWPGLGAGDRPPP